MLISRVSEGEGRGDGGDCAGEYQTADELFELMAKDHSYDTSGDQSLSARDLIILYKNIDVGTKLMSNASVQQRTVPNQHVETVVYKDERESDDSDVSEIYSNEDLQDIFSINNERIDLINNLSSFQHPLCHKFGNVEIQPSNVTFEYDSQFLFKDPYIKQQLKNINMLDDSTGFDTMLPASLLDYICCRRLEDNYNFYMDNVIRYVQHTIEQLKRISNGDYLTDRAKEKWREVAKDVVIPSSENTKVLATSVSIPIHVMGKIDRHRSTWDDIVHSEVDVRSLSKILEKKIIIEVPKLICGSYKLFTERCADNLIISCKKDLQSDVDEGKRESRVNVVFQLKPSGSRHVISNINSIMILQKMPVITTPEPIGDQHKDVEFDNGCKSFGEHPKIVEIDDDDHKEELKLTTTKSVNECNVSEIAAKKSVTDTSDCSLANNYYVSSSPSSIDTGVINRITSVKALKTEKDVTLMSPDELRCAIRKLNMQTPVPEESEESSTSKKKSPTRVRIKSPYENQSYSIEEKKRKKLLEIREKREKKKMAISENCKITKHKYGKGAVMAQPSSSVTKLSITNKSFYNSIYGENGSHEGEMLKKSRKLHKKDMFEQGQYEYENRCLKSSLTALDGSCFDDGNTETIMQMQKNLETETYPTTLSAMSNYNTDVNMLSQLIGSSGTDCSSDNDSSLIRETRSEERHEVDMLKIQKGTNDVENLVAYQSSCILVPVNSPNERNLFSKPQDGSKKTTTPVECRKSIDKIYELLKNLGNHDVNELTNSETQYVSNNNDDINMGGHRSSTIQVSDSGTSVKHHVVSSNPSTYSFGKNNNSNKQTYKDKKKKEAPATVVPKVIISTKLQTSKVDTEWNKTDRKRAVTSPTIKVPDNPLRAISQLLHEFNNVQQKTRHKALKKVDHALTDVKPYSRQGSSKKHRQEQSSKDAHSAPLKSFAYKEKSRSSQPTDPVQLSHQITNIDDKHTSRVARRNISDIIDEAKEARGEAVRGPSKPYSRLNTLAQPKKLYVQAHNDEYQNKYGKNLTANRLQRTTPTPPLVEKNTINMSYARNKRRGPESASVSSAKPGISTVPPLERIMSPRRSASNSPARKRALQPTTEPTFRQINVPKSPDLKKKMVAVESYVNSHYGHKPIDTSEHMGHEVHKSRVPLIPNDIELASLTSSPIAEESTALGNKLHYMVDTMINTNAPILSILAECKESTSKLSDGLEKLSTDSLLKIVERKSESDYPVDIFEDKSILTAVGSIPKDKEQENKVVDENIDIVDTYDIQPFNSATELRKLENALYQQMSVGTFPKRLRIKNLTLTPKQSLQNVIVVQSGDAGSLLVKSSLSQNLRNDSKTDSLTALKPLTTLSNTHINWGFTNIPLQVATIGYAFPTFKSTQRDTLCPCVQTFLENPSDEVNKDAYKSHKTSQCFKGVHTEACLEQATQANIVMSIASTSNFKIDTHTVQKENNKKESVITKCENIQPINNKCEIIQPEDEQCEQEQPTTEKCETLQPIMEKCEYIVAENFENVKKTTEQCETITEKCHKTEDIITSTKMHLCNEEDISEGEAIRKAHDNVDHSTSLDILMGLLNEIRKITGEAINKNNDNELGHNDHNKELQIILNNAATHESSIDNNCRELVSVSSFERLGRLDSNPSIYSFSILKDGGRSVIDNENKVIEILKDPPVDYNKPKIVDKNITADIKKPYVNKFTDAPLCLLPLTVNHSTNVTNSVIEILSGPSTRSVYSLAKYESLNCDPSYYDTLNQQKTVNSELAFNMEIEKGQEDFNVLHDKKVENNLKKLSSNVKVEAMASVTSSYKRVSKINSTYVTIGSDFDPVMKIKRDILVTVYSILVFTVFAALSFPKVFYHIEM